MENQLKLYVDNTSTSISGKLKGQLYKDFKRTLGYEPENAIWMAKNSPYWDGFVSCVCYSREWCKCAIKKDGMHFPTGLISKATEYFQQNGIEYEIVDVRDEAVKNAFKSVPYELAKTTKDGRSISLHDYQQDAVTKAITQQRGILQMATGSGKSFTAAAIIASIGVKPVVFYVTSIDLLNQAANEIENVVKLNGHHITVGKIGGGFKDIQDINVMTVQTAVRALGYTYEKYDDEDVDDDTNIDDIKDQITNLIQSAKLFVQDEVQHAKSVSCQIISDNSISARWRFGASATPYRDAGDDILIESCFGKTIVNINASHLINRGFLVRPSIAFVHIKNLKGQKLGAWPATYKAAVVENQYRNEVVAQLANNLKQQGRTTLILIQQIQHGEILASMIPDSVFLHGSSTKKTRREHLDLMRAGKAPITIASSILDEGVDVRALNALILAGGGKSSTRALQRIGRVIRTYRYPDGIEKKDAFVYDIYDHQKYLTQHGMARRKIYMTEPAFDIQDVEI